MNSTMINFISLSVVTAALAAGQILFKQLGLSLRGQEPVAGMLSLARNPTLYLALAIYALATILWIWVLSRVPLTRAYPWIAAGTAIIPLLGWLIFDEQVAASYWVGLLLIVLGLALTQYGGQAS